MTSATGRLVLGPAVKRTARPAAVGIDPGPTHSAYAVVFSDYSVIEAAKVENDELLGILHYGSAADPSVTVVIESIVSYGQPVGKETFETCYWIGEFRRQLKDDGLDYALIPRQEYVNSICGCKGNDTILRQALLLRFGGDKKGEPLNCLKGSSDLRSAYALAVYWLDAQKWRKPAH